jgi:hypothetical protein
MNWLAARPIVQASASPLTALATKFSRSRCASVFHDAAVTARAIASSLENSRLANGAFQNVRARDCHPEQNGRFAVKSAQKQILQARALRMTAHFCNALWVR